MTEVYLAQWRWDTSDPAFPQWGSPAPGAIGCLDLRSLPEMAHAGGVSQGWGIFTYPAPMVIPGALALGSDLDALVSPAIKATIRIRLGIPSPLSGDSLIDVLWEALTTRADPTGSLRSKPLMPTIQNALELHLGGFSLIRSKLFSFSEPEGPNVLAVLQDDYRGIRQERLGTVFADTHKRLLGGLVNRFGVDYRQFIPGDLPDEGLLEPHTTILDNFNRADSPTLGTSSEGWSWTEVEGDLEINTNRAGTPAITAASQSARAENDLNSADHTSQGLCDVELNTANFISVLTRFAAAATTYYAGQHRANATATYRLIKVVAGVFTSLGSQDAGVPANPVTDIMSSNGSTQEFTSDGVVRITLTDSSITGNLRSGILLALLSHTIDNFNGSDLQQGAGGYPSQMHNRRPRAGRLGRGFRVPR